MGSTSACGTRGRMVLLMQMVAVTAVILFINLPIQVQGAVETDHPDVVDDEGHPVLVGEEYTVLPAVAGSGGGLALKIRVNNSCPLYVRQLNSESSRGFPLVLKPAEGQTGNYSSVIVQEHVNMNVNMPVKTVCVQSTTSWSAHEDANTTKRFIKASDASSLFQIVKAVDGDGYVLYFCPCNCRLVCTKVGVYVDDDENRWLVIDNSAEALRVKFHKA